jgi:hypothetical protein
MPYAQLDRSQIRMKPLAERENKKFIERDHVPLAARPKGLSPEGERLIGAVAQRILAARAHGRPVMLTFGAHTIKNGLAPVLIELVRRDWVTHLATNGAGIIHDWEFAYLGQSSEDVRANVARGQFGTWEETGRAINLAIAVGGLHDLGYGWSVGKLIAEDGLEIPSVEALRAQLITLAQGNVPDVEALRDRRGLVDVLARGDLRHRRRRCDPVRAQHVDRTLQQKRRVDAAGESDQHATQLLQVQPEPEELVLETGVCQGHATPRNNCRPCI